MLEEEIRQGHTDAKLEVDYQNNTVKYDYFTILTYSLYSVLHDKTNVYRNSQFDYVLDQDYGQNKLFDKVGVPELIRKVVDVSKYSSHPCYKN